VILTSSYSWYFNKLNTSGEPILIDQGMPDLKPSLHLSVNLRNTKEKIIELDIIPIVILPHPTLDNFNLILRSGMYENFTVNVAASEAIAHTNLLADGFISAAPNALLISATEEICSSEINDCNIFLDGDKKAYLSYDGSHLSRFGAEKIVGRIIEKMDR
jgi:hypothetical protein